ncbi:MAG: hydantoinase B/oxoprolinase family protein [Chloroflexi bacterium]|nr:hydantoinase B/oxoprolinase family protein [Chloroflexota bacterium]
MYKIGIDVGGTFTDFVVVGETGGPRFFKTPTTPDDPSQGVMIGLREAAAAYSLSPEQMLGDTDLVIHGSTVATNTLVERKGAKVGLITTDGFRDLLEMREGLKEDRYNLRMTPVEPLAARYLRVDVPERIRANGVVHRPLDTKSLEQQLEYLVQEGAEALAVCFLFSYLNPSHEQQAGEIIRRRFPDLYTSLSHEVIPQIKEFDRLSTTVINSYVGPVFSRYLAHLGERFESYPQLKDVLIMQSNGGVAPIDDSRRMAVRAILSGPAGGVSAAAYLGQLLAEPKIIAFDMGGTSTDISLIENGVPHITNEKFEAGWKIAAPMIDIHTLGAGGGSIARVDEGGILHVGPDSAGADPGPACYRKGGVNPTVTDASLALGYLDASNFLGGRASLDTAAAQQALADHVGSPLNLSDADAAFGVFKVVCTTIAEGIRLMSVQRGVDPREFSMMGFGGASGLHASEVARQLQVGKVYIPSSAPVLSAYGMLNTDIRYDFFRSYPVSLDRLDLDELRTILAELGEQGRQKLLSQGVVPAAVEIQYSADMRYLDQIYEVTVPLPDPALPDTEFLAELTSNFHRRYEELYSYNQQDQEVRLVTLRSVAVGKLPRIAQLDQMEAGDQAAPVGSRRVYLEDWCEAQIYAADQLPASTEITGPAILESECTTILMWPGDRATVDAMGGVELQVSQQVTPGGQTTAASSTRTDTADGAAHNDPITMAVVEHRLESIAQEMTEAMLRTAMSQILNSSRDFSTAILDGDCQLVAQGEGIPVHISALPVAGAAVRDYFGEDIHDGDLFILNDPYFGGSHLPDITIIRPVFHQGQPLFYGVNRAHHSDVGGGTHGGYNPGANEIFQEGLRIPPLRLYDKGVPRNDLLQMMSANVRQPENFLGDLNAQIGSVTLAAQRIRSLLADYGADRLMEVVSEILAATERQVRQFISGWPDGVYRGESLVDDDGFDSKLVPIRATVTIAGDSMTIDLSESSPQVEGFINSAYANTRSLAHAAIMYLAPMDVARNEGSMRPVQIVAPRGLVVNANPPAPVCMSTNHCAEEVVEAVFKALAPAIPAAVSAGFSRRLRYAITGMDPRTGRQFIWHFFLARGGGGASEGFDGWSNVGEINVAGGIRSPSIEVTEERFPLFIERHELLPDSGGPGAWRGGLGAVCDLVYEGEGPALLNTAGDGVVVPPFGLFGGAEGRPHHYKIVSDGTERVLGSKEVGVLVNPGDHIICLSSGGGGYGEPGNRERDAAAWDLKNGYVTYR